MERLLKKARSLGQGAGTRSAEFAIDWLDQLGLAAWELNNYRCGLWRIQGEAMEVSHAQLLRQFAADYRRRALSEPNTQQATFEAHRRQMDADAARLDG